MFNERGELNLQAIQLKAALGLDRDRRRDIALPSASLANFYGFGQNVGEFVRVCWGKDDTRKMLIFVTINLLFMFVELGYGVYSNSLGLISDSFHMLSDCISLFVALGAAYVADNRADSHYTYGFQRVEVLAGMFNGFFLIFVGINVFIESIERIYEPQYIQSNSLLLVSVLGLLVNIVGLVFFHEHAHSHAEGEECPMSQLKAEHSYK